MSATAVLHVTFGTSAAGSLKQALALVGRSERVTYEDDDLGYGPIEPYRPELRLAFEGDELGLEQDLENYDHCIRFWSEMASTDDTVIAWFSRRCVREYVGLHALLARRTGPTLVVDVADVPFLDRKGRPASDTSMAFGFVGADEIVKHRLFDSARALSPLERSALRSSWSRLVSEGAPLRVLENERLVSAPLEYFDADVQACVTADWQPAQSVVGQAWRRICSTYYQVGDLVPWSRLRWLVEAGIVEGRGEMLMMRDSEVRLPAR